MVSPSSSTSCYVGAMERTDHLSAELHDPAVGQRRLLHAPAGAVARLEDDHVRALVHQIARGAQAGQACARDNRRRISRRHPFMSDTELRALTALGFDELRQATGGLGSIHQARGRAGVPGGRPGRGARAPGARARSRAASTRASASARARSAWRAAAVAGRREAPAALSTTPRGSALIAAVTGLRGDALEAEGSPLCQPMAVRVEGRAGRARPGCAARGLPGGHAAHRGVPPRPDGDRVLVAARRARAVRRAPRPRARLHPGLRALQQRPPHLGERALAERADGRARGRLARWTSSEVALVGHSMGGLVARSACCHAAEEDADWVRLVQAQRLARHARTWARRWSRRCTC